MAMYRLSASVLSRSQGRCSVAAAAYRAGEKLTNARDGKEYDYARRTGVVSAEVLLPPGAPSAFAVREVLWNAVEAAEKRKDAQLAREVQLALPHELDDAGRADLVRGFVRDQFVARGMIADVAIHAPGGKGDDRNHHAHVLLTTRAVSPDGFEGKNRDWNAKELLEGWRADWADAVNRALEAHEVAARVDHRSLEDQRAAEIEASRAALDAGEVERASEHTVQAEALNREPRIYMKREDYQRARQDPGSYAGQVLQRSYEMMGRAQARAEEMLRGFREVLNESVDRLDNLLAMLRGEGRASVAGGATGGPVRAEAVRSRGPVSGGAGDALDRALDALRRGPDRSPGDDAAARARQAVEAEEQRRADLARQADEARVREAEAERLKAQERERDAPAHQPRDSGTDFGL